MLVYLVMSMSQYDKAEVWGESRGKGEEGEGGRLTLACQV